MTFTSCARRLADHARPILSAVVRRLLYRWAPRGIAWNTDQWALMWNLRRGRNRAESPLVYSLQIDKPFVRGGDFTGCHSCTDEDVILDTDRSKFTSQYSPSGRLFVVSEARVHGPDGAIVSPDGRLLWEFTDNGGPPDANPVLRRLRFSQHPAFLAGNSISLVQPLARNYFHWITESLSSLARLGSHLDAIDTFIIPAEGPRFQLESLALLGIDKSRIHLLAHDEIVICERLYCLTFRSGWLLTDDTVEWFHHHLLSQAVRLYQQGDDFPDRLYISRADALSRKVKNEAEVVAFLGERGFQPVTLTSRSIAEQIMLFHRAKTIIAVQGASLTNILFCKENAQLLEIFPPRFTPLVYYGLARVRSIHYTFMNAEPLGRSQEQLQHARRFIPHNTEAQWAEFTVPIEKLSAYIQNL